jgi:hypothetical protein
MFWLPKAARHNNNTRKRRKLARDTIKFQIIEIANLQDFFFCFKVENGVVEIQ